VIVAASLAGLAPGADPHIWYDPAVMSAVAQAITRDLVAADPQDEAGFEHRLEDFRRTLEPARDAIRRFRATHAGIAVTATEPVFAYMLAALGVDVRNRRFQIDVMNGTEPSAADVAAFETSLRSHQVRLLIYNSQVTDALTERMRGVAEASGIPVLGVPETEPAGTDYQHWIGTELRLVSDALSATE
jgi:zinc/manganese transport system substrate-binding protein